MYTEHRIFTKLFTFSNHFMCDAGRVNKQVNNSILDVVCDAHLNVPLKALQPQYLFKTKPKSFLPMFKERENSF